MSRAANRSSPPAQRPADQARRQRAVELYQQGDAAGAEKEVRRLLKRAPKDLQLREFLGLVLVRGRRFDEGVRAIQGAIDDGYKQPSAYSNLSLAFAAAGRLEDAIAAARQGVALAPKSGDMHLTLGNWLKNAGHVVEAKAAYQAAIDCDPKLLNAVTSLGNLHAALGERAEAIACYRKVLAQKPNDVAAFYHLAISEKSGQAAIGPETIQRFQAIARSGRLPPYDAAMVANALGHLAEREGNYPVAFGYFARANELRCQVDRQRKKVHDRAAHSRHVDHLTEAFPAALFETPSSAASDSRRPIVIVGMPRSGTTLIDQLLAKHPDVAAGGERLELPLIAARLPSYPGRPSRWSVPQIRGWTERYLADLDRVDQTAPRVTDKYPSNFLHLGLLARLVPGARIVHCRRDALDTCLSCFTQNFAQGNVFSHDMSDIAAYYKDYHRLMAHWRQVLPMPIVEVDYDALTSRPEPALRALLEELELPWAPECLTPEAATNPIFTASQWQARQPINNRAVGRWRNFQAQLGPLIAELGDLAQGAAGASIFTERVELSS
ncbi:MAG: sulfotransferase [Pseudomonadota bacterium]